MFEGRSARPQSQYYATSAPFFPRDSTKSAIVSNVRRRLDSLLFADHTDVMRKLAYLGLLTFVAACSGGAISIPDPVAQPDGGGPTSNVDASTEGDASTTEDASIDEDAEPTIPTDAATPTDVTIPPVTCNVDFLLLTNSSGSMGDKQTAYLAAVKTLPSQILALNGGRVDAVTTSDIDNAGTAGLFMKPVTPACEQPAINRLWLTSTDTNLDAAFACRANVGFSGSGVEQGLGALSLAVEATPNRAFFRPGALFAYLMILDDGDESTETPATLVASTVTKLDAITTRRSGVVLAPKRAAAGCAVSAQTSIVEDFVTRETATRASRTDMCNAPYRFDLAVAAITSRIDTRCRNQN